jgi:hypothetical protein
MKFVILSLFLLSSSILYAQKKSSNHDLREKSEVFHIKDLKSEDKADYKLETSNSGEFSFTKTVETKDQIWKVDTKHANEIDEKFSDHFISMKYMMGNINSKKCVNIYQLSMRGEIFNVCNGDGAREKIISTFVVKLMNKFNN